MTLELFDALPPGAGARETIGEQALVLRDFALPHAPALLAALAEVEAASPFRRMTTPGGFTMSVALTGCGRLGWTSDRSGYRYSPVDPLTGAPWPPLPEAFLRVARSAADAAGFAGFEPDACLVNRYEPGARLALHQDKDERDLAQPIVSVSLGLPAVFLFGGARRADRPARVRLAHGDVVVWGGASRLRFHGVAPLREGFHEALGARRVNLTFRKAG
jgi:alkylated DNA repair protein (DNA oxidative demethylase)